MTHRDESGFTLVEIMIVVAIIAILAAVAIPSYQDSATKSRRSDAKAALSAAAAAQERYFFQNNGYTTDVDNIGGDSGTLLSPEEYYTITIGDNDGEGSCTTSPKNNCFTLTALPVSGGPQAGDGDCARFTLNHRGVKTAVTSGGSENKEQCW